MFTAIRTLRLFASVLISAAAVTACDRGEARIDTVEAFRKARSAGNFDEARTYLGDDPRVWYEERAGEGRPVELGAGRWKTWDDHFRSSSDIGPWTAEGTRVWAIATETNDYYRLIEREGGAQYRVTYFFDDDGRIEGYMISDPYPGRPAPPRVDRIEEIAAWAKTNHPDEWEYLRPGGKIDPTGDRARRTRYLLNRWREEVGLPVIE